MVRIVLTTEIFFSHVHSDARGVLVLALRAPHKSYLYCPYCQERLTLPRIMSDDNIVGAFLR